MLQIAFGCHISLVSCNRESPLDRLVFHDIDVFEKRKQDVPISGFVFFFSPFPALMIRFRL